MADAIKPICLVGEALGANEERLKSSFVGASGVELLRMMSQSSLITLTAEDHSYLSQFWQTSNPQMVEMVWKMHPEVYRTNVFNFHPPSNDIGYVCGTKAQAISGYPALIKGKFVRAEYQKELDRLADELISHDPNLIICLGNTPLWSLAGTTGISKLRGTTRLSTHCASGFKLLPTYHPAAVLRQWELRPTVIADFIKASREAQYPEIRRPQREIWIEPTLEDLYEFERLYIKPNDSLLSVDIETAGNRITCLGLAPSRRASLVIPFDDSRRVGRNYWPTKELEIQAWAFIQHVMGDPNVKKVFQNGLYDIAFLLRSVGIRVRGAEHDTMLLAHSQQPEALKGLAYLGSIYSTESAWKSERKASSTIKRDA